MLHKERDPMMVRTHALDAYDTGTGVSLQAIAFFLTPARASQDWLAR